MPTRRGAARQLAHSHRKPHRPQLAVSPQVRTYASAEPRQSGMSRARDATTVHPTTWPCTRGPAKRHETCPEVRQACINLVAETGFEPATSGL